VHRSNSPLQASPPHDNSYRQFAGSLSDGDNVDPLARHCREYAASEAWSAPHAFADNRQQADIFIYFHGLQVSVIQFQSQIAFNCLDRYGNILFPN
jgi:hypothetical protein